MINKRIDQLPNIASLNLADLFPLWDSSASTTGYATLTQLQALIGGGSVSWGSIGGTLSSQTDLQNALNAKASLTGFTMSGNIAMGGNDITGVDLISGTNSIDFTNGWIYSGATISIDFATRNLVDTGFNNTLNWQSRQLLGGDWTVINKLRFATGQAIADANGNNLIGFPTTIASAVNWLQVSNSISGNPVLLTALGSDTNVGIRFLSKGTGNIFFFTDGVERMGIANSVISISNSLTVTGTGTFNGAFISAASFRRTGNQNTTPTNGGSTTISNTVSTVTIDPAGVIASHTYTLPTDALTNDGQEIVLTCRQNGVTALTLNAGSGSTIVNAITTISAGQFARYWYRKAVTTWYRIG